ncbi:MAG: DUF4242 domain-containing protein [Chitinophagaceae bacterium]
MLLTVAKTRGAYTGKLSQAELQGISQKSCSILNDFGSQIQWMESYVTDEKIYCVYQAPNKEIIKQHADVGGFPANRIEEIKNVISPVTAKKATEAV